MNKKFFYLILVLVFIFLAGGFYWNKSHNKINDNKKQNELSSIVKTGVAKLSWKANSEPDLAGYKIYYGIESRKGNCPKDGAYENVVDVKNVISYTLNNLEVGKKYYFSVTSYDKSGNESCFSGEMSKDIK